MVPAVGVREVREGSPVTGAPLWTPMVLDAGRGIEHRSYLRLDGRAWRCAWLHCEHVLEPRDSFGGPRLVLAEEILAHAQLHGVRV